MVDFKMGFISRQNFYFPFQIGNRTNINPPAYQRGIRRWKHNLLLLLTIILLSAPGSNAQVAYGKITYERKTNLYKKFKWDDWVKDFIKEADKNKVDVFELYFNDTCSVFKPQESELKEQFSWATSKNQVYQNFKTGKRLSIKEIWGEQVYVADSLWKRSWKITDNHRTISGYKCRKAIWQINDSTRMYAWYSDEIMTNTGPESFNGLPGAILGLATEDGGVIYFAKNIERIKPSSENLSPQKTKSKIYSSPELRKKLEKDYGKEKWGKAMIRETFDFW